MFFDLNIPVKKSLARLNIAKKSKQLERTTTTWTAAEIAYIERRVDVLVHFKLLVQISSTLDFNLLNGFK
jgi:ribonuclease P/MRP protein subunit RPP1